MVNLVKKFVEDYEAGRLAYEYGIPRDEMLNEAQRLGWDEFESWIAALGVLVGACGAEKCGTGCADPMNCKRPLGVRVDALWSRTVGDALELSGLAPYIKDGDLAHLHAALRFVELMRADGVPVAPALRELPVTLEQIEELARTMWKGEPVPGRVLRFGAAVLGLTDAALGVGSVDGPQKETQK